MLIWVYFKYYFGNKYLKKKIDDEMKIIRNIILYKEVEMRKEFNRII